MICLRHLQLVLLMMRMVCVQSDEEQHMMTDVLSQCMITSHRPPCPLTAQGKEPCICCETSWIGWRHGDTHWNLPSPSTSSTALQIASCASRHIFSNLARIAVLAVPALQRLSGGASMACDESVLSPEPRRLPTCWSSREGEERVGRDMTRLITM